MASVNVTQPTAEDLVAQLKKGGFLKEGAEAGATKLLEEQLATMQGETHGELLKFLKQREPQSTAGVEGKRELEPQQIERLVD